MARPKTAGIDYFPFDVSFFHDIKVRRLLKREGTDGVTVYSCILCLIYKNGYFLHKNDDIPFISSEETGVNEEKCLEIMNYCAEIGLFDADLYNNQNVLTSKGIQLRYENICKMSRRASRVSEYSLLPDEDSPIDLDIPDLGDMGLDIGGISSEEMRINTEETIISRELTPNNQRGNTTDNMVSSENLRENDSENNVSSENLGVSSGKSTQSKVNKSKVNKSKVNKSKVNKSKAHNISSQEESIRRNSSSYTKEEKEKVFSIFFWMNFVNARKETDKFYNWNELREWKTRDGVLDTEEKRLLAAKLWSPESKEKRCAIHFLGVWRTLYDEIIKSNPEVAAKMLDERSRSELTGTTMNIYCNAEVWSHLSTHNQELWPLVADKFQGLKVQWKRI